MKDLRLVIGNKNYSSWSLAPWLLLNMHDVDFEEIQIALYQDNTAEKLGPYSPSLKVPVVKLHDVTVWDSLSICEYLSEEVLLGVGWPVGAKRRAAARSISAEMHSEFPHLKRDWPMNCSASVSMKPSEALRDEIARIDAIICLVDSRLPTAIWRRLRLSLTAMARNSAPRRTPTKRRCSTTHSCKDGCLLVSKKNAKRTASA